MSILLFWDQNSIETSPRSQDISNSAKRIMKVEASQPYPSNDPISTSQMFKAEIMLILLFRSHMPKYGILTPDRKIFQFFQNW